MNSESIDVQSQQILSGVEKLESILTDTTTERTLDLQENNKTSRNLELLKRVKHSLTEYTQRGKDLLYVGLMGHFSAGKSSTINSLINAGRAVDLNPTDKDITLLTHKDNKSSIILSVRENIVPIRSDASF